MKKRKEKKQGKFFTPSVIVTTVILAIILFVSIFADQLAPFDPEKVELSESFCKPFENGHILGTDRIGRDLLSRIMCGAKVSVFNAFLIVAFEVMVGVPIGLISGYYGGKLDTFIMRIWDIVCSLPTLLLAFVLVAAFGKGMWSGIIAMGIVYTPLTAKLARSLIMTEKTAVYVEAAKSMGYSNTRIIFKHIMPNIITTMIAQFTLDIGSAITSMASLSYLGLGVQPPACDWGTLLKDGMSMLYKNPVLLIAPAAVIIVTSVSINIFSDGIQAYIDPNQRKMPTFKQYRKSLLKTQKMQEKLAAAEAAKAAEGKATA